MGSAPPPPAAPVSWFTPANLLTGLRLAAAPFCASAIACDFAGLAATLFAVAVVTDLADGRVARSRGESSARGALLDHATDATFVTLGLGAVALSGEIAWPLPLLVAAAFVQYTVDSRAHVGRQLRASALGRWNGIAYFVLLGTPVIRNALGLAWPAPSLVWSASALLALSTLASMVDRWTASRS